MAAASLLAGCAAVPADDPGAAQRAAAEPEHVAFDATAAARLKAWRHVRLPGKQLTAYSLQPVDDPAWPHRIYAIQATARSGASMLWRGVQHQCAAGDAQLEWHWRLAARPAGNDPAVREADDAPARILLAFDGDKSALPLREQLLLEAARALSGEEPPYAVLGYATSAHHPPGTVVHSPRTSRVRTIIVAAGELNTWQLHRRDICADYRLAFQETHGQLTAIGLMTDADNSRSEAAALYGPLKLLKGDGPALLAKD
jgi:hypothetical protein